MAFLIKAGRKRKPASTKHAVSAAVLARLEAYLDSNADKPAKFLMSFWKDQETAFTYKEIREAVLSGVLAYEILEAWRQDYSKMVSEKMYPLWLDAITAGVSGQPIFDGLPKDFSLNTGIPDVVSWIDSRGAEFVTTSTEEQKKAVKAMLVKKTTDKYTTDELARIIRPCIGLTEGQAKANLRYYDNIKETLAKDHPRMKKESIERKAREAQIKYAARQHRERAYTIAHTEMAFAFNKGMDATIRQAQEEGLMGIMEKRWITAGTDHVCRTCKDLNGKQIGMDETFGFPGRVLFPGHKLTPPAHPRCRCAVQYIEVSPPVFEEKGDENDFIQ